MSKDGGAAFPIATEGTVIGYGMTLRDWFAAAALQGLLAGHPGTTNDGHWVEKHAYDHADAMLRERDK